MLSAYLSESVDAQQSFSFEHGENTITADRVFGFFELNSTQPIDSITVHQPMRVAFQFNRPISE